MPTLQHSRTFLLALCALAAAGTVGAQSDEGVARPEGLYLSTATNDPDMARAFLWRFKGEFYYHRKPETALGNLQYDPAEAALEGDYIGNSPPDGKFDWTGDELVLRDLPPSDGDGNLTPGAGSVHDRFGVRELPDSRGSGCFALIDARDERRELCPAPAFPVGLLLEGIWLERRPRSADAAFTPAKLTFWKNRGYERDFFGDHHVPDAEGEPQLVYGRIVELGAYRINKNTIGFSERGTKMAFAPVLPLGEWLDAETPRTLYAWGRRFDFVGLPPPMVRPGLLRESLDIPPRLKGQPYRIYKTWIRLSKDAVDPGEGNDPRIEDFPERRNIPLEFGARLTALNAKKMAEYALPGVTFGLRLSELQPYAASWDSSLQEGDVLLSIGGVRVKSAAEFRRLWRLAQKNWYEGVRVEFVRPQP